MAAYTAEADASEARKFRRPRDTQHYKVQKKAQWRRYTTPRSTQGGERNKVSFTGSAVSYARWEYHRAGWPSERDVPELDSADT